VSEILRINCNEKSGFAGLSAIFTPASEDITIKHNATPAMRARALAELHEIFRLLHGADRRCEQNVVEWNRSLCVRATRGLADQFLLGDPEKINVPFIHKEASDILYRMEVQN
jgi:hypothetical protein